MSFFDSLFRRKSYHFLPFQRFNLRKRILLINWAVLIVPVIGVLWSSPYRQSLIESELNSLQAEAEIYASAFAEGLLTPDHQGLAQFDRSISQHLLRQIAASSGNVHAHLWNQEGKAILDSRTTTNPIYTEELYKMDSLSQMQSNLDNFIHKQLLNLAWLFSDINQLPIAFYPDRLPLELNSFPEVQAALTGEPQKIIRRSANRDYTLQLSVSVPIQQYKRVYGSLQLIRNSRAIDNALADLYKRLFLIFLMAKIAMAILSFWLSSTIASPLYNLTTAANYIRENKNRKGILPDFSHRTDEIGQLSANLRAMLEALWKRMDAIEAFADDVSHELKNPLTSLKSAVETLDRAQTPEQVHKLKQIINQDVGRLNRLITDISNASRLDTELSRTHANDFDFKKLTFDIHSLYRETYRQKSISFVFIDFTPYKKIVIKADDGRIMQVIRNLIGNAISFSPAGGIITSSLKIHNNFVMLEIMDEGPGIAEHALEKIFHRFYTERPKSESFGNHSGLGLSISLQIVQNYNGSLIAFNRKDGKTGAVFRLSLPFIREK